MKWTLPKLSQEYATLWDGMTITKPKTVEAQARSIIADRAKYEEVSALTNVPWFVIGILDLREGGGKCRTHLHNGDSLQRRTRNVPAGRPRTGEGPFSFVESACDALRMKGYHEITDWSVEQAAYCFERYNGFGYRDYRRMLSPYLWGATNHQEPGKYIRDGVFSKSVMDPQVGCMALLKAIADLCPDVQLRSMHAAVPDPETPSPASNRKTDPPPSGTTIAVGGGLGLGTLVTAAADPAGTVSTAVAVKTGVGQLLAGVDLSSIGVPLLILAAAVGAAVLLGRK